MGYARIILDDLDKVKRKIKDSYESRIQIYGDESAQQRVFRIVMFTTILFLSIDFYVFRSHLHYVSSFFNSVGELFAQTFEFGSSYFRSLIDGIQPSGFWGYLFYVIFLIVAIFLLIALLFIVLIILGVGWLIVTAWNVLDTNLSFFSPVMAGIFLGSILGHLLYYYIIPFSISFMRFLVVAFGMEPYFERRKERKMKKEIKALEKYVPQGLDKSRVIGELERIDGNRGMLGHYISNLIGQVKAEKDRQLLEKLAEKYEALYNFRKIYGKLERVEKEERLEENRIFIEAQKSEIEAIELKKKREDALKSREDKFEEDRKIRKMEIQAEVEDEAYRRKLQEDVYRGLQDEELRGEEVEREARVKKLKLLNDEEAEVWREFELQKKRCEDEVNENKRNLLLAQAKDQRDKRLDKIAQRRRDLQ